MKKINKILLSVLFFLCAIMPVNAQDDPLQDPKYGGNPDERRENIILIQYFTRAVRGEMFDEALVHLRELINRAPQSSENLYYSGITIYKNKFKEAGSAEEKAAILDTIRLLYDLRLEHFSDHPERGRGYILKNLAADLYTLNPDDTKTLYSVYEQAIKEAGADVDMTLLSNFQSIVYDDYTNLEKIGTEEFLNAYDVISSALDISTDPGKEAVRTNLDNMLVQSGAANCDVVEEIYKERYESNPEDIDLIKKIVALMNRYKCGSPFQLLVTEKYYQLEPSSNTAMYLSDAFDAQGDKAKAAQYLQLAIDTETDITAKSNLVVKSAATALNDNNYRQAADFARQAISINSENGYAYIILAQAYSGGVNSQCSDDFSKQAAHWLIVDVLNQAARRLPSGDPQLRSVNSLIGNYSTYFPNSEELFFKDIKEGSSYTVSCGWINGQTTVRARK
ncbi:MAG: hypothetical protein LIO79_04370 [Rikenellaceae bacterium]|nr:hypothetical protein [Rikenellaceae bacterium]